MTTMNIENRMRQDFCNSKKFLTSIPLPSSNTSLEVYRVAATLYSEAGGLNEKGIIRVAETIRNRYNFYKKNLTPGVAAITYTDIVAAPRQYLGYNPYKGKNLSWFQNFEKNLQAKGQEQKKAAWERCLKIARQVVNGQLTSNLAHGALGFNQASVESNRRTFGTQNVFRDDSTTVAGKPSPHVFIGDYELSPLLTPNGKKLANGGNPKNVQLSRNNQQQRKGNSR